MSQLSNILLVFIIGILFSCSDSQEETLSTDPHPTWFKGNLHTHSYWSDGDEFPEVIMSWYRQNGYHFVSLSDHNILAEGEFWVDVPPDSIYQAAFKRYLQTYGNDWVTYKEDSNGISVQLKTFKEYKPLFQTPGEFLILQAEEITDSFQDKPLHLNATNLATLILPQGGSSVVQVLQRNINAVIRQRDSLELPMIVHINHPNYGFAITLEDMIALQGEQFFELFNGHPQVYNLGDSIHMDTESMWDQINIAYLQSGKPLLYGLATDDSHNYHNLGSSWSNSGRGWIQVRADTLSPQALISAMEKGDFYSSTGVTLKELRFQQDTLHVQVEPEDQVNYEIQFIGCDKEDTQTEVLKKVIGPTASLRVAPNHLFVRVKIISNKKIPDPIESFTTEMAWTQPVLPSH